MGLSFRSFSVRKSGAYPDPAFRSMTPSPPAFTTRRISDNASSVDSMRRYSTGRTCAGSGRLARMLIAASTLTPSEGMSNGRKVSRSQWLERIAAFTSSRVVAGPAQSSPSKGCCGIPALNQSGALKVSPCREINSDPFQNARQPSSFSETHQPETSCPFQSQPCINLGFTVSTIPPRLAGWNNKNALVL